MNSVLDALSDWIESKVRGRRLRWLISIPAGIGGVASLVFACLGWAIPAGISQTITCVFLAIVVVVLALARRGIRQDAVRKEVILRGFGDRIRRGQEKNRDLFHVTRWQEEITVTRHGDSRIVRDFTIVCGERPLPAIFSLARRNSSAHFSDAIRRKLRLSAWHFDADGKEQTRIPTVARIEGDRSLRAYFYFDRELQPGEQCRVRMKIDWPRYAADIIDGETEVNYWKFHRATENFSATITFDSTFSKHEIRVSALDEDIPPHVTRDKAGTYTRIHLGLNETEVDREYGYRVSLATDS